MVNITANEMSIIEKIRGIINGLNMPREKLLGIIDKLYHTTENVSKYGLNKIAKMQNLSLNEHEEIERMNNLSLNELKQTAKIRHIKNYEDMSKEDLLIALLKSNKSHAEIQRSKYSNTEIEETKKIFNKHRNNFSKEEIHMARKKFDLKEGMSKYLEEFEQKDSIAKEEKND